MTTAQDHLVTETRTATLDEMFQVLTVQRQRQRDVVVPAARFGFRDGMLHINSGETAIDETGTTDVGGLYRPMRAADGALADRLHIPRKWLEWTRANRPDLYDQTVNGMLHGGTGQDGTVYPPNDRKFLIRAFQGDPGQPGICRTILSDRFKPIDHLDILVAAMSVVNERIDTEIREALGIPDDQPLTDADRKMFGELHPEGAGPLTTGGVDVRNLGLSEDTMHVRILFPGLSGSAPKGGMNYRDPFREGGATRVDGYHLPSAYRKLKKGDIVNAGLDIRNSAVGTGSYWLTPMFNRCICDNGQVIPVDAIKTVHLGGQLDEGEIDWSDETRAAAMALAMSRTRDAMRKFTTAAYLDEAIAKIEGRETVPVSDPAETIKVVAAKCQFSDEQSASILRMFTLGGMSDNYGVLNAVTAAAQAEPNPNTALDMEYKALTAMDAAAAHASAQVK